MGRFKVTTDDGKSYVVTTDDATPAQSFMDQAKGADATTGIQQAAPSNLGRMAGIASVNAPGVTSAVVNSIPGIGQPSQIMPSLQNIRQNPGQLKQAGQRLIATQAGQPLKPQEKAPALVGQAAGTALEVAGPPSLGRPNIKPTGPFTAGLKAPETALPGEFNAAGEALGKAKTAARAGEDIKDAARVRGLLSKPAGVGKLAEEALTELKSGKDIPITRLLAYKEAVGKMQAEGGTFANDYAQAQQVASQMIAKKAPDLAEKLERMHINFLARGNPKATFPWFTVALNHATGLMKAATLPVIKNTAGAMMSPATRVPGNLMALGQGANSLKEAFSKDDQ